MWSYLCDKNVNAINILFSGNKANVDIGAIYAWDNVNVDHCLFESNRAEGAEVSCVEDDAIINNYTFKINYAENKGGAVYASALTLEDSFSYFEGNTARDYDGEISTNKFNKDVTYTSFINNKAQKDDGRVIYIYKENPATFSQCTFVKDGEIYSDSGDCHITLKNNIFIGYIAREGQTVYSYGSYGKVKNNKGKNPTKDNDQLIRWICFSLYQMSMKLIQIH